MRSVVVVAVCVALSGCFQATDAEGSAAAGTDAPDASLRFSESVQINADAQEGFEPSIRIAPDGTVYAAAARGFGAGADGDLASPVWFSEDAGTSWTSLASDASLRDRAKAIEGDLAVDAEGTVYFVDTYMADNVLSVWNADRSWRQARPIQGTLGLDDRPWLAAHGDGIVYYVGNSAASLPAPDRASEPMTASRYWFYRSTDAGATWTLGHAFTGAAYCHVAASPADDRTVAAVCTPYEGVRVGDADGVMAYVSRDRGAQWESALLGSFVAAPGADNFPSVAFSPDGQAYAFWIDDGRPSKLQVRSWGGTGWQEVPAPEVNVRAANPWIASGPNGSVALAFYGHEDSAWHLHVFKRAAGSEWAHWRDPVPVSTAACPPEDFFQTAIDASGRVHVVFQRDPDRGECAGVRPANQPILHVREQTPQP